MEQKKFILKDTLFCKGVAVCLLLFDHLFGMPDLYSKFFYKFEIFEEPAISVFAQTVTTVCVAVFVFLSAYGMTLSYKNKKKKDIVWIFEHVKKLYFLYWPVFIIGIIYGYVSGLENPFNIYDNVFAFFMDFFALSYIFYGISPFSSVWWYISFALVLYIFFPLIYKVCQKSPKIILVFSFLLGVKHFGLDPIIVVQFLRYAFVICLGCCCAENGFLNKFFEKKSSWKRFGIIQVFVVVAVLLRWVRAFTFDGFLALAIVLSVTEFSRILEEKSGLKKLNDVVMFLGKHSANIFLIHGLIYINFYQDFIYWFYYPPAIFVVLLLCSLICSVIVEKIKSMLNILCNKVLNVTKLNKKLSNHIDG